MILSYDNSFWSPSQWKTLQISCRPAPHFFRQENFLGCIKFVIYGYIMEFLRTADTLFFRFGVRRELCMDQCPSCRASGGLGYGRRSHRPFPFLASQACALALGPWEPGCRPTALLLSLVPGWGVNATFLLNGVDFSPKTQRGDFLNLSC